MLKNPKVELLAPAGNPAALKAAVEAGADAVYLGGKQFNMRLHRTDMNFDNEALREAVNYAHANGVRLYITINNLISEDELPALHDYLLYLDSIKPDAILVQDFAVVKLIHELGISIPIHSSVMMNIHNEAAMQLLKQYHITRIVASRELSLQELALLRERTGLEIEYFMHGDMCISESGQCIHSGVLFNQSSNRGRCLKPCRWPYQLVNEATGELLDEGTSKYRLALKDMCMYRALPELIQSGVCSFKIEGRMRPPEFISRIVSTYRQAIDRYLAEPASYATDEAAWQELLANRARDFSTCFALNKPTAKDIGFDGSREPRFFSNAVQEFAYNTPVSVNEEAALAEQPPLLSVRVAGLDAVEAACKNGADIIYYGGEAFQPAKPVTLAEIKQAVEIAHRHSAKLIVRTTRTTTARECAELAELIPSLKELKADGLMVGNIGALALAKQLTDLPLYTDYSFNLFNSQATHFLAENGAAAATASLELTRLQLRQLSESSALPLEVIVHGAYEAMICDHNIAELSLGNDEFLNPAFNQIPYALKDEAGECHSLRLDQHGRCHIYFAKDLCLYQHLHEVPAAVLRLEAQLYDAELTGKLTKLYADAIKQLYQEKADAYYDEAALNEIMQLSPRQLGIGSFRFNN